MIDLSQVFNKSIELIRSAVIDGIKSTTQLNGKRYTPNRPYTVRKKGYDHRLIGKNKSFINAGNYAFKKATRNSQTATLEVPNADIALYNQTPTGKGTIAKKDAAVFWGISEKMEKDIMNMIDREINKQVDQELVKMGFRKV